MSVTYSIAESSVIFEEAAPVCEKADVILPFYNEPSVCTVVKDLLDLTCVNRIFAVDDYSEHDIADAVREMSLQYDRLIYIRNKANIGKSASVKRVLPFVTTSYVILQDADLEYPVSNLWHLWLHVPDADMVVARRFVPIDSMTIAGVIANRIIIRLVGCPDVFSGQRIVKADFIKNIDLGNQFDMETVLTYEAIQRGLKVQWVDSLYYPRGYDQGKKAKPIHMFSILKKVFRYKVKRHKT